MNENSDNSSNDNDVPSADPAGLTRKYVTRFRYEVAKDRLSDHKSQLAVVERCLPVPQPAATGPGNDAVTAVGCGSSAGRTVSCSTCRFWRRYHDWLGECRSEQPASPSAPGVDYRTDGDYAGNVHMDTTPDYGCVLWEAAKPC